MRAIGVSVGTVVNLAWDRPHGGLLRGASIEMGPGRKSHPGNERSGGVWPNLDNARKWSDCLENANSFLITVTCA